MQATWKWLSDAKHGIPIERRQELMAQYSLLMRSETESVAENYMEGLRETIAYPKYKVGYSCIKIYLLFYMFLLFLYCLPSTCLSSPD